MDWLLVSIVVSIVVCIVGSVFYCYGRRAPSRTPDCVQSPRKQIYKLRNQHENGNSIQHNTASHLDTSEQLVTHLEELDQQMMTGGLHNFKHVYTTLEELAENNPVNVDVLWHLAKSAFILVNEDTSMDIDDRMYVLQTAHDAAKKAVQLDHTSGDAHKWLAVIIFLTATDSLPVVKKLEKANDVKEHIQAAINYKPNDAQTHYMLGRLYYEVYMLPWHQRLATASLFNGSSTEALEEAISCFHKAEELNPGGSIDNALYLAKEKNSRNEIQRLLRKYDK